VAAGPPDCEPEDLPLLNDAEKARCRNQIDADKARPLARAAREDAARQLAEAQRGPKTRRMSSEKETYYDAVADAYWQQSHGPPNAGHSPSLTCGGKPKGGLRLGPCTIIPPQGFLTEETGVPRR
jgi:hypothetical protein